MLSKTLAELFGELATKVTGEDQTLAVEIKDGKVTVVAGEPLEKMTYYNVEISSPGMKHVNHFTVCADTAQKIYADLSAKVEILNKVRLLSFEAIRGLDAAQLESAKMFSEWETIAVAHKNPGYKQYAIVDAGVTGQRGGSIGVLEIWGGESAYETAVSRYNAWTKIPLGQTLLLVANDSSRFWETLADAEKDYRVRILPVLRRNACK